MRVQIVAVGRMKSGPERELVGRYIDRAGKAGRALGLGPFGVAELPESRAPRPDARRDEEAAALLQAVPQGSLAISLDERGEVLSSDAFARLVADLRDRGTPSLCFLIGGADGHGAAIAAVADRSIAFGAMTWPHQLVRILLAEQLYRTVTILSGHPYHRA